MSKMNAIIIMKKSMKMKKMTVIIEMVSHRYKNSNTSVMTNNECMLLTTNFNEEK